MVTDGLRGLFVIQMIGKNLSEKEIKASVYCQLVACPFVLEGIENAVGYFTQFCLLAAKMVIDHGAVVDYLLDIGLAGRVVF